MDHDHARCLDRRRFLGLAASLGLGLALRERALADEGTVARAVTSADAVIVLWMAGGMSQTDTFDPKPGTKSAGPLGAIKTAARDVQLSELLPRTAERMRDVALVRSLATREGAHDRATYLVHTGWAPNGTVRHPELLSSVADRLAPADLDLPACVVIGGAAGPGPGLLGAARAPFVVADPTRPVANLAYPAGVDAARFDRRRALLEAVEKQFRKEHPSDATAAHEAIYVQADRLMHGRAARVCDLQQEPQALRERYGPSRFGQGCLLARRLVEAGVKSVEVTLGGWDTHRDAFTQHRRLVAELDQGYSALLADLAERGRLSRTLVLVLTEFGRTPKVNEYEGRDHFATGWSAALAGGGVRGGAVVGATSADGTAVADRPVSAADLHATVARLLGLDPKSTRDTAEGRPISLVDPAGVPIAELL